MLLIQLPDGEWYEPGYIIAVEAAEEHVSPTYTIPPRVILHLRSGEGGDRRTINCESLEAARAMRDDIAGLVNINRLAADTPQVVE